MGIYAIIHACVSWSHFVFFIATQDWQELKRNYPTLNSGVITLTPTPPQLREPATAVRPLAQATIGVPICANGRT